MCNDIRSSTLQCALARSYQLFGGGRLLPGSPPNLSPQTHTQNAGLHYPNFPHPARIGSKFLTILIVFEIVIRTGAPAAFCRVPQVLELQKVGSFAPEAEKGRRKSPSKGHQTLGAAGVEKERGKDPGGRREAPGHRAKPSTYSLRTTWLGPGGSVSASVSTPAGCPGGTLVAPRPCQLGSQPQPSPSDSPMLLAKGTYFQRVRLYLLTVCMG